MLSTEILMKIDLMPFDEDILENISDGRLRGDSQVYCMFTIIYRYFEKLHDEYGFPTSTDVDRILKLNNGDDYFEAAYEYLLWNNQRLFDNALSGMGYYSVAIEVLISDDTDHTEYGEDWSELQNLLKHFSELVTDAEYYECGRLEIITFPKLAGYLSFRENYDQEIQERFKPCDQRIMSIIEDLEGVFTNDNYVYKECVDHMYMIGYLLGTDGYYYYELDGLNPHWVISMHVLNGLLESAEQIFQYKRRDELFAYQG